MSFSQVFSTSVPAAGDKANLGYQVIQNDKKAIDERINLEHIPFTDTVTNDSNPSAGGRHRPGAVRAVYIGTTAQIAALTGAYRNGALAYDTTTNQLKIHNGTDWTTYAIGGGGTSGAVKAALSSDATITANGYRIVSFVDNANTDCFDISGTFASNTHTPTTAGYYRYDVVLTLAAAATGALTYIYLTKNGATESYAKKIFTISQTTDRQMYTFSDIISMNGSTDYVRVYIWSATNNSYLYTDKVSTGSPVGLGTSMLITKL
jgi:hypothetical protein